jgi:protein-arginine kinase activator protein McsA
MKLSKPPKVEQPVAEQPKKTVVCPDCNAELKDPATATRFTCSKCNEVFTAPSWRLIGPHSGVHR